MQESMRNIRRGMLIAEFIFFLGFLGLAAPMKSAMWSYLQLACLTIWVLLLLIHIFWFNRKPVLSYFSTRPRVSKRGLRQFVVFILAGCMVGIVVVSMPILKPDIPLTETVVVWLPLVLTVAILGHIWLNRKPFLYYLGRRTGLAAWLLGCLLLCLGIVIRVCQL